MKQRKVGWKISTLNPALASLRYRAMLPILALEELEIKNKIFYDVSRSRLDDIDVLVIVKSFTLEDYWLAQEAVELEIPVIFDLCDNIFIEKYEGNRESSPEDIFLLIANIATAITVTTEPLVEIIRKKVSQPDLSIYVVPDGVEDPEILAEITKRLFKLRINNIIFNNKVVKFLKKIFYLYRTGSLLGASKKIVKTKIIRYFNWRFYANFAYGYYDYWRARLTGVPRKIIPKSESQSKIPIEDNKSRKTTIKITNKIPKPAGNTKTILWFGQHGAAHGKFGMLDLLMIHEPLEALALEMPLELVVVSNNLSKYQEHILPIQISTRYFEWKAQSMEQHFQNADVVVLPNSLDDFSKCKSANRSVLSLTNGVPVVATATSALEPFRGCIAFDDFESNLRRYLLDSEFADKQVKKGQEKIEGLFGQKTIGHMWSNVIDESLSMNRSKKVISGRNTELIVVIHLPQDIDLAYPVLKEAFDQGLSCSVWSSLAAVKRWPSLLNTIRDLKVDCRILPDNVKKLGTKIFPTSAFALLSVTESNLNPHQFTYNLAKLANSAGLFTATMQHGFENIGLSYSDQIHNILDVQFASKQIFTWGGAETLHPQIPLNTRKKCLPVGCPKHKDVESVSLPNWKFKGSTVIGIFENLHWHRYSDEYRTFFLESLDQIAEQYPEIVFLVKPHNAGMWLTQRYQGDKPQRSNIVIADPMSQEWAGITAPQLIDHLSAIITTPSTVALDAARKEKPTAVVAQKMNIENYTPLSILTSTKDWISFISQVLEENDLEFLQEKSIRFVDKVLVPSEKAAWRIVDEIRSYKPNPNREKVNAA